MEEQPKMEVFGSERVASDMETYVNNSIVLIGKDMESAFRTIVKANKGSRTAIYLITEERKINAGSVGLRYDTFEGEEDFVTMTDIDGKSMDTSKNGELVTYPIVMRITLTNVDSDRKFRHAAEIISSTMDNSLMTVVGSNVSEEFSRKIHSAIVYRRKRFTNPVASVVYTNSNNGASDFMWKVTKNNIEDTADIFKEIKGDNRTKSGIMHRKELGVDTDELVQTITDISQNFKIIS